jgi:predicted nuclease of predicted toxin-antitoxin system
MPRKAWSREQCKHAFVKILFDHGTPAPLRRALIDHVVSTAREMGWSEIDNGSLLAAAEKEFDAIITTDQSMRYQQNVAGRKLAILVLPTTNWRQIRLHQTKVAGAVNRLRPGDLVELKF